MIYTDNAIEILRNILTQLGVEYAIGDCNDKSVNLIAKRNNVEIDVWFDIEKQLFGFNMLQGGSKVYEKVDEFTSYFSTYLEIYSSFLPTAKLVANEFEKEFNYTTIYDNFIGNQEKGYTAVFRILGIPSKALHISFTGTVYTVSVVVYSDDKTKFKNETVRKYNVDTSGNVDLVIDIDFYMDKLTELYGDNDDIMIHRADTNEFVFRIGSVVITTLVTIEDERIIYNLKEISGVAFDNRFDMPNPFDINTLYVNCKQLLDDFNSSVNNEESVVEEPIIEERPLVEDITPEVVIPEPVVFNNQEVSMNFALYKVMNQSVVVSIQIVMEDNVYSLSLDKANELGIPVDRIMKTTSLLTDRVIAITDIEKENKSFAKDISNDDILCSKVLNMLFE